MPAKHLNAGFPEFVVLFNTASQAFICLGCLGDIGNVTRGIGIDDKEMVVLKSIASRLGLNADKYLAQA